MALKNPTKPSPQPFGRPLAPPKEPRKQRRAPPPPPATSPAPASAAPIDVDKLPGLTTEDIASFKALGVEVLLKSERHGELWLVPAYTGKPRKEIAPEHVATVIRVPSAFPGSQVISFEKSNPERPERPHEERP
jgi:hypothetical protein